MRVLVIHNAYRIRGGEDVVVDNEIGLLREHGHTVDIWLPSNDSIRGWLGKLTAAAATVFSLPSYFRVRAMLRSNRPDVVHVHNFFPLISPAGFYACRAEGVAVVHTLHNYRVVCPTALLMFDGQVTERSLRDGPWWALRHRVYRGSFPGTFMLCLMISVHRWLGTWAECVDRFIVLSQFAKQRFEFAGVPASAMAVKPNFVDVPSPDTSTRIGFLFVGRLSPEKGVEVLLDAARLQRHRQGNDSDPVLVAGTGPLSARVASSVNVRALGALDSAAVAVRMREARALVLPSIWYEGFPMVLVEAFSNGLPVIASRIGALAELIEDGVTGLLFDPGNADDLAEKMFWTTENPEAMVRMGRNARACYEAHYTPERNYEQLMTIYGEAVASQAKREGGQCSSAQR